MKSAFVQKPRLTLATLALAIWLTGCAQFPKSEELSANPTASPAAQGQPEAPAEIKAIAPTKAPTVKPKAQVPLEPPADIWVRIRQGFAMPDLDNELVKDREEWYASRPDYILRMTERSRKYLFHIVEELERRTMPTELALLPFIESAFNPEAVSSAKAAGMWQFMPATGKYFDL